MGVIYIAFLGGRISEVVFVDRLSLFTCGLYSGVIYISFLGGRISEVGFVDRWSLFTGDL